MDDEPSEPVSVKRWRRYGMDRLYVNESDGRTIGWRDLLTGELVIQLPNRAHVFESAIAEWMDAHREELSMSAVVSPIPNDSVGGQSPFMENGPPIPYEVHSSQVDATPTDSVATDQPSLDLAQNLPGQGPRARAIAEQRKYPVMSFLARILKIHTDERAWRMGEKGENLVARNLAGLDDHWHVLHSIPIGDTGADVDHLVIGPAGVFTLNTKHHKGASIWVAGETFMVNGERYPYIRNSRYEAQRVGRILGSACDLAIDVRAVIVVVNAHSLVVKEDPGGVQVVNRSRLREWLAKQTPTLNGTSVESIFAAARWSLTWTSPG